MKEKDFLKNNRLFSDYYLEELLPKEPIWDIDVSQYFKKIKEIYERKKDTVAVLNEPSLEDQFIRPILRVLDHKWEVNPSLKNYKKPDYSFYETEEEKVKAELSKDYFGNAIAVGEIKRWERPLDKKLKDESDPFEVYSPSLQIDRYLWFTEVKWGILTNGRLWRIYERGTSNKLDIYYEVDLINILENYDLEAFKYFCLFFRKEAFPDFLDKVYEESIDYAKAVGEDLKSNVYKAIRILANGFLETPGNNLSIDNLQEIHDSSLIFLYRLLFILYAESRGLLPLQNPIYRDSYSFYSIKNDVVKKIDKNEPIPILQKGYWSRINVLFDLINIGSESYDISEDKFFVPPYNGGLFDPYKNKFLEENDVSDSYIAEVIDLLSRSTPKNNNGKAFVDYKSLDIRHLGSIYEGLLENKLKVAEEDMSAIKKGKKEIWIKTKKLGNKKAIDNVSKGGLYPVTDKGERKATGSYYTPDYIVKYIVENTIGPLIEEKKSKIKKEEDLIDEILSLKILDPAIGSGHFLVEATDFIARSLVEALGGSPKEDEEEDIRWARREVVERCIYGVDLNPLAVELAKLSLWLSTVSINKPLSFLDHHLKCGNSLIGARIRELGNLPIILKRKKAKKEVIQISLFEQSLKKRLPVVLGNVIAILKEPSDKVEQIKEKENIYNKILNTITPFKDVANIWMSYYFDNKDINYEWMLGLLETQGRWQEVRKKEWFLKAHSINKEKHFFHWELEFPEIFFDKFGGEKDNHGFDVIIGNPPYGRRTLKGKERDYIKKNFYVSNFPHPKKRTLNSAAIFLERSYQLIKKSGNFGMIIPGSICRVEEFESTRKFLLDNTYIYQIVDEIQPFVGVTLEMISLFFKKLKYQNYKINIISKREYKNIESNFINKSVFDTYNRFILYHDKVFEKLMKNSLTNVVLGDYGLDHRAVNKDLKKEKIEEYNIPFLHSGSSVNRYFLVEKEFDWSKLSEKERFNKLKNEEVIITTAISTCIRGTMKPKGLVPGTNVGVLYLKNIENLNLKALLLILNSNLIGYFIHKYMLNFSSLTIYLHKYYTKLIPIKIPQNQESFIKLANYMLFLHQTRERQESEKEIIEFFDKEIIDSLVYELYFVDELKTNLIDLFSPHLEDTSNLDSDSEKMDVIKEVYLSLINDKEIINLINKIKSYPWIQIIEESSS